jgi:nitroreductase
MTENTHEPEETTLTPDELLSTTRAVRRRLDLERPVERELIEECVRLAQQAPNASNREGWHFVVVTDAELRRGLAELYREGGEAYLASAHAPDDPRVRDSARYLIEHLQEVPVLVIPCIEGRTEGASSAQQSARWGTIGPATWSFMLAARARGLGTTWTTFHLRREREAANLLGIPYDEVMQVALLPLAHTIGTDFKRARRSPVEQMLHWDRWD